MMTQLQVQIFRNRYEIGGVGGVRYVFINLIISYFSAPGDYNAVSEQLTFTPAVMRLCFNVISLEDDLSEADEDFNLNLGTADENVILDPEMAVLTIANIDRE